MQIWVKNAYIVSTSLMPLSGKSNTALKSNHFLTTWEDHKY